MSMIDIYTINITYVYYRYYIVLLLLIDIYCKNNFI